MAFSATLEGRENIGSLTVTFGTFANADGSTGGDIQTGLSVCNGMILQHGGASVVESSPTVSETFPVSGLAVTVVTVANTSGWWLAWGA